MVGATSDPMMIWGINTTVFTGEALVQGGEVPENLTQLVMHFVLVGAAHVGPSG